MKMLKTSLIIATLVLSPLILPTHLAAKEIDTPNNEVTQIQQSALININTATAEEISKALNGIGINKAKKIIEYREKLGPFVSVEQLKDVSGIGQATLDKNRDKITL